MKHSVNARLTVAIVLSIVIGVAVMLILPVFGLEIFSMYSFGMLLMFILMGRAIGFAGTVDKVPVIGIKAKWWVCGPFLGAAYMLMFVLLTYTTAAVFFNSALVALLGLRSPFWALVDGAIIGAIIAFVTKRLAGEGSSLPKA